MHHATVNAFVSADRAMDAPLMGATFADDISLISPLTNAFRFEGREAVTRVFASAFDVLTVDEVHTVTGADDTWTVFVRGHVGARHRAGQPFEECQLLRLDDTGHIREITLIGRPVSASLAVMARIGTAMHRRGLMSRPAAIASAGIRPIAAAMAVIERFALPAMPPKRLS